MRNKMVNVNSMAGHELFPYQLEDALLALSISLSIMHGSGGALTQFFGPIREVWQSEKGGKGWQNNKGAAPVFHFRAPPVF